MRAAHLVRSEGPLADVRAELVVPAQAAGLAIAGRRGSELLHGGREASARRSDAMQGPTAGWNSGCDAQIVNNAPGRQQRKV
jgi:hypothetical protein